MSCYVLELSVEPGGMRKTEYFCFNKLLDIKKALCQDFLFPTTGIYAAVWYGERIMLHVIEDNRLRQSIDLHPCLSFKIGALPEVRFDDQNQNIYLDQHGRPIELDDDHFFGKDYRLKMLYSNYLFTSNNNIDENHHTVSRTYSRVIVKGSDIEWVDRGILETVEYDLDKYRDRPRYNACNSFIYRVDIDWKQAQIPELQGKKLRKNEQIVLNTQRLNYGANIIE